VDTKEIRSDLDKVKTILKQPRLTTIIRVQAFLEAADFFKKYIQDFGKIVTPLHHITSNKVSSYWTSEMEEAWEELQYRLIQTSVFRYPDFNRSFILYMDTSKKDIRTVLCQKNKDIRADYVIQYYS